MLAEVDVIVLVVEAWAPDERDDPVLELLPEERAGDPRAEQGRPHRDKGEVRRRCSPSWATRRDFAALVPVSAEKGTQLKALLEEIRKHLPEAPPVYEADDITDRSERFLAAELVRERIFRLLGDELPYSTAVVIEQLRAGGQAAAHRRDDLRRPRQPQGDRDRREGRDA